MQLSVKFDLHLFFYYCICFYYLGFLCPESFNSTQLLILTWMFYNVDQKPNKIFFSAKTTYFWMFNYQHAFRASCLFILLLFSHYSRNDLVNKQLFNQNTGRLGQNVFRRSTQIHLYKRLSFSHELSFYLNRNTSYYILSLFAKPYNVKIQPVRFGILLHLAYVSLLQCLKVEFIVIFSNSNDPAQCKYSISRILTV